MKSWASLLGAAFQLAAPIAGFVEVLSVTRLRNLGRRRLLFGRIPAADVTRGKTDLEVNILFITYKGIL